MKREEIRSRILPHAMQLAVFEGWNDAMLDKATLAAGFEDTLTWQRVFPHGCDDVLDAYSTSINDALRERVEDTREAFDAMRIREKITWLIAERIRLQSPHKEALKRAMGAALIPTHSADASKRLWRAADTCWQLVGDQSIDLNYYTKRLTLSKVYAATLIYWVNDTSADHADTLAFLSRRINNVMQFEKFKAKASKLVAGWLPRKAS